MGKNALNISKNNPTCITIFFSEFGCFAMEDSNVSASTFAQTIKRYIKRLQILHDGCT